MSLHQKGLPAKANHNLYADCSQKLTAAMMAKSYKLLAISLPSHIIYPSGWKMEFQNFNIFLPNTINYN